MRRADKLLDLCLPGSSSGSKRYTIAKVIEMNQFRLLPTRDLLSGEQKHLHLVEIGGKMYHAIAVKSGEQFEMNMLMEDLIKYEKVLKMYSQINHNNESTQTEDVKETGPHLHGDRNSKGEYLLGYENPQDMHQEPFSLAHLFHEHHLPVDHTVGEEDYSIMDMGVDMEVQATFTDQAAIGAQSTGGEEYSILNIGVQGVSTDQPATENYQTFGEAVPSTSAAPVELVFRSDAASEQILSAVEQTAAIDHWPTQLVEKEADVSIVPRKASSRKVRTNKKQTRLTKKRKGHHCKFCKKLVANFSRHLLKVHPFEEEVVSYKNISTNSEKTQKQKNAEKTVFLRKIMAEGDDMYNKQHPHAPIVRRKSAATGAAFDKCPTCKLLISKNNAVTHYRRCNPDTEGLTGKAVRVELIREEIQVHEVLNEDMKTKIIPVMRNDSIRKLCETDASLIMYGNNMCERLKGEGQEKTIRNHLRVVARVAEKTIQIHKMVDETISSVSRIFEPYCYESFVRAIKEISGYGEAEGEEMMRPTTPHQYGPRMRELADSVLTQLLKKSDPANANAPIQTKLTKQMDLIKAWLQIYDRDFDKQVASLGRKQAERRTFDSKQLTPSLENVQKLIDVVQNTTVSSFENLKKEFSHDAYNTLTTCLLLRLWTFNRRRVGEVDKLRLKNWQNAKEVDESSVEYQSLSRSEQICASSFMRLSVQGKLRRPAALLVPKKDLECFELIISLRDKARVSTDNPYLFAKHDRYIEGTAVMSEYAKKCGVKEWRLLTGTRLRKQLAATLRFLNLTDEDLRLVAEAMGHTEKTHLVHYRKNDPALHAGRVSRLLMAIDDGTIGELKGKSLVELDKHATTEEISLSEELVNLDVDVDDDGTALQEDALPSASPQETMLDPRSPSPMEGTSRASHEEHLTPIKKVRSKKKATYFDSDSSSEKDSEPKRIRGNTPGRKRAFSIRRPHKNIKWSKNLKDALKIQLAEEIKEKTCPSTKRVLQAMGVLERKFPDVVNHSPKKVKALVTNMFSKKK